MKYLPGSSSLVAGVLRATEHSNELLQNGGQV